MKYKGIILAAGGGTRLYPASLPISKILLPVYDKPMIFYPVSNLISAGIKDILIISNPYDIKNFKRVLKDGSHLGVNISYEIQYEPKGIADALIIAEDFLMNSNAVLMLGDNIFYGQNFNQILALSIREHNYATIFGHYTETPEKFGIVEFDENYNVISIEEKPEKPKSNYAAVGLYIYDNNAVKFAKQLTPSKRNELEITDLNKIYLKESKLNIKILDKDIFWQDTGSFDSLLETSIYIRNYENNTGRKIGCIEEAAINSGFVTKEKCLNNLNKGHKNEYYNYLYKLKEYSEHV